MKRVATLTLLLVIADQASKVLAAHYLIGRRLLLAPGWGLTYTVNPGLWINHALSPASFPWLQAAAALLLAGGAVYLAFYHRYYRRSLWIDLAYASLLAGTVGNLFLDRFLMHGIRDFLITPIATSNAADLYGSVFFLLSVLFEFAFFPRARRLLRWTPPSRWLRESRLLWRFFRRHILSHSRRPGT